MTLIAAWITPEFRIVASDSKATFSDGYTNFDCQKIFSSNELGIGVYGNLSDVNMKKIENYLQTNPNNTKTQFIENLPILFPDLTTGKNKLLLKNNSVCHLLIIPKNDNPELFCFRRDFEPIRYSLEEYKELINSELTSELFFSEQLTEEDKVDVEHQNQLENHFKSKNITKRRLGKDIPVEGEELIQLVIDATNTNYAFNRKTIGGDNIYYAYSVNKGNWFSGVYPIVKQGKKPLEDVEILNFMTQWLKRKQNSDD